MKKLLILAFGILTICTASAFSIIYSGGDLVTNGEFYTDTDWTKEAGWTISGGTANCNGSQSGDSALFQASVVDVSKKYRYSFDWTRSAGDVGLRTHDGSYNIHRTITTGSSGTATGDFTTTATSNGTLYIFGSIDFVGSIDNVIVKEVKESAKIDPALDPTRMPYSPQKIGEWTLAESDQQSDTRTLLNSSAGTSYVTSTQAYGKFDFSLYTTGSNHAKNTFISTTTDAHGSGDGYTLYSDNNNAISLRLKDDTVLFTTADSYTADDTWYFFRIERLGDGTFTVYIKGGVYSDFTLIDTVTNNTYTTSAYMVADLDVGDAIRGVHVGGFKPVSEFVDGTGTTSVTGNLVVSDKGSGRNHGTWYGESRRGEYTRFDGTDDYIDVGDTGKTVNTVSFWIKPTTTSEDIIDLDGGTHTIEVSSGTITATGFSSPTIYVDGSVSSTLDTDWHHVAITTATGFSASDLDIGKETTYFDGTLASVQLFGKELSIVQINQQLTQTKPVTKWVKIGDQVWMQDHLNVGTKIDDPGSSAIATACAGHIGDVVLIPATTGIECYCISATYASCQRSGILGTTQKYCYSNLESNCDTNGALYEWQEAMDLPANCAYTDCSAQINTPHQGICPDGWHIPTDTEWKTLEGQLGMTTAQQDLTGWRGTNEGDKMKTVDKCFGSSNCGTSGFSALLAGYRYIAGGFSNSGSSAYVWSASQTSSAYAWRRSLGSGYSTVTRSAGTKHFGFSLRCLRD